MDSIKNYNEIALAFKHLKDKHRDFYTNFYLDESECLNFINHGQLFISNKPHTTLIFRRYREYFYLYFITNNTVLLQDVLINLNLEYQDKTFICDLLGFNPALNKIASIFLQSGFYQHETLRRMSRNTVVEENPVEGVDYAEKSDIQKILSDFEEYFDELCEQIPTEEQLEEWVKKKSVLSVKIKSEIAGFAIFEINGMTSYLRYWFVHPAFRELKIGSKLLKTFFYHSNNTKRELFWVIEKNENAIKRYQHYGFNFEKLQDIVLINKK